LLECKAIEYTFDIENSHNLNIEGFKLSINYFLIALATEIAVSQPAEMQSLFKKKGKKEMVGVKGEKNQYQGVNQRDHKQARNQFNQ
jgi:hypothetical protein